MIPEGLSPVVTPEEKRLRAQVAALTRWSKENPAAQAASGQAGLQAKFIREAFEADPAITDEEAARRGLAAWRAHLARMSLAASRARTKRAAS